MEQVFTANIILKCQAVFSNELFWISEVNIRVIFAEIEVWRGDGKPFAIATNVKKDGAPLRPLGAKMAMTIAREIAGSVTGGCIKGVMYEEAQAVIKSGVPKLLHYGVTSEETLWEVGPNCSGSLDMLVESLGTTHTARQTFECHTSTVPTMGFMTKFKCGNNLH